MILQKIFKKPETIVWTGFGSSVAGLLAFLLIYAMPSMETAGAAVLGAVSIVLAVVGILLSVWGMMMWAVLDTPKWVHFSSIGISVVNVLFPIPSAAFVLIHYLFS